MIRCQIKKLALNSRASEVSEAGGKEETTKQAGNSEMGVALGYEIGTKVEGKGGQSGDLSFIIYPQGFSSVSSESDFRNRTKTIPLSLLGTSNFGGPCLVAKDRYDWDKIPKYELKKGSSINIPIFVYGSGLPFKGNVYANVKAMSDRVDVTVVSTGGLSPLSYDRSLYSAETYALLEKINGSPNLKKYFSINPYFGATESKNKSSVILSLDIQFLDSARIKLDKVIGDALTSAGAIFACIDLPDFSGFK